MHIAIATHPIGHCLALPDGVSGPLVLHFLSTRIDQCSLCLLQCLWRCYAAEPMSHFQATWLIHIQDLVRSDPNTFTKAVRRTSIMKRRRFSKSRFELGSISNHMLERKESDTSIVAYGDDSRSCRWRY